MRIPWTARRSNQSILKKINCEYSLEELMLKLKCQYFGHPMGKADSLEKSLMLGKIEGRRRKGQQRMRWHQKLNRHEFEQAPGDSAGQGSLRAAVHGVTKSRTRLSTALICVQHVLIHSSVDEHLGCFRVLAIENTAAVNFGDTHVFLNYSFLRVCAL